MEKYEEMNITDIINLAKYNPSEYLACLRQGMFSGQLNSYFVDLYKHFMRTELREGIKIGDVYSLLSVDPNFNAELIYAPWARNNFIEMLNNYSEGPLALDIQLGGGCNLKCWYCDSSGCRHYVNAVDLKIIRRLIEKGSIKQIYICGLGEPTEKSNISKLKEIILMAEAYGIKVSMYTNILNMDNDLFEHLRKGTLNVLYKHDTNVINSMKEIYRCSSEFAQIISEHMERIKECVRYDDETRTTNIGASIVPTKINVEEIPGIIETCFENHIYPLPLDLEKAGEATDEKVYTELKLDENSLLRIKNIMRGHHIHKVDMCPATPLSAHITNLNFAVTSKTTGSSCAWSSLKNPEYKAITFLADGTDDVWDKINFEREKKLPYNINPWLAELKSLGVAQNVIDSIKKSPTDVIKYLGILCYAQLLPEEDGDVLGGCGGETREIQKVLSLSALDSYGRRGLNCVQHF